MMSKYLLHSDAICSGCDAYMQSNVLSCNFVGFYRSETQSQQCMLYYAVVQTCIDSDVLHNQLLSCTSRRKPTEEVF